MATPCDNCLDFTKLGCDPISTDNVIYSGVNLACSGIVTNDDLTLAFQKMEALICQAAGSQNLQSVLSIGNTSTDIPILMQTASDPLLFTTVAFDRVRVENGIDAMTLTPDSLIFGLASTTLKAEPSVNSITYLLGDRPAGIYTLASIDQVPVDADLLHKTGNEVKDGTLTVNAIIKALGLPTQYLMADGSTSDISGIISGIVAPTIVDGDTTHAPSGDAVYDALNLSLLHDVNVTGAVINQYLYKAADGFWKNKTIPVTDVINAESIVFKGVPNGYTPLNSLGIVPNVHIDPDLIGNVSLHGTWDQATNTPNLDVVKPKGWYYECTSPTPTTRYGILFRQGDWIVSDGFNWSKVNNFEPVIPVTSVFGRTGDVVAVNGDYTTALVPDTTNKRYQTDNQQLFNDATSSIQTQLNSKAADTNVLHITGNESFTGIKSSTNTGVGVTSGFNLTNSPSSGSGAMLVITNNGSSGQIIVNNTGTGLNITSAGNQALNLTATSGRVISSASSGGADNFSLTNTGSGNNYIANQGPLGTGFNFVGRNNSVDTFTVDKLGNIIGASHIKTGAPGTNILLAGGTDIPQSTFALASALSSYELLANKQNNLNYDGTGIKYSTVDAVNNLTRSIAEVSTKTGLISKLDTFDLIALTNTTARIAAVQAVVFWNELFVPSTAPGAAIKSFAQKDYPLAQLETPTGGNVNINPVNVDGKHVRYLGYDKNGNVYSSQTTFATNNDIFQFGIVTVLRTGGVISFLDGTVGPRNVLAIPNLASNTDFDKVTGVVVSITIAGNVGASFSTSNGTLTGISINWKSPANPSNSSPIDVWNYVGVNPAAFRNINPLFLNGTAALSTHTLWTELEGGIQINERFFNTTTQLPGTMANGSASVKRIMVGIRGSVYVQDGEHPNTACYPDLATARNNLSSHKFSDAILPLGVTFEIARIAYVKDAVSFTDTNQVYILNTAGSSASSSSVIPAVPDATVATKGILQLAGDFDPTSTAALPIIRDATAVVRGLMNTGVQTFAGAKTFNSTVTATAHIKSGAPATNILLANGTDIPQSTFALAGTAHNPVTIGTANGLSLAVQVLSLALADNATTGALSSTDWNTFNNKAPGSGSGSYIQNQNASAQSANMWISGTGRFGAGIFNGIVDLTTNYLCLAGLSDVAQSIKYNSTIDGLQFNGYGGFIWNTQGTTERMRITNGGNVGIGTGNPVSYPDYIGLTIGDNAVSKSGWLKLKSTYNAGDGLELLQLPTGEVFLSRNSTSVNLRFDATGIARIPTLGGTGVRMVVSDASGNLSTQAIPSVVASPITLVGTDTLASTAIGAGSSLPTPVTSIYLGQNAGNSPTSSAPTTNNIVLGTEAARNMDTPQALIAIGYQAAYSIADGNDLVLIGTQAGYGIDSTYTSIFIGKQAGYGATSSTNTVFIGTEAGYAVQESNFSTFLGYRAGKSLTSAGFSSDFNILLGYQAGYNPSGNNIGSGNIIIGTNLSLPNGQSNSLNIGGILFGTGLNQFASLSTPPVTTPVTTGKIGIGILAPVEKLDVNGYVRATGYKIPGGTSGQFLMADGSTSTGAGVTGTGAGNYIAKWANASSLTTGVLYDNGNIGIGTTNPLAKLTVAGGLGGVTGEGGSTLRLVNTDAGTYVSITAGITGETNEGMQFSTDGTKRMVIRGGAVGIGTTDPLSKLHITDSGNIPLLVQSTSSETYINLKSSGSDSTYGTLLRNTGNDFGIYHGNGVLNSVYIKGNTGNFGVHTSNPLFDLTVSPSVGDGDVNGIGVIYHPDGALNRTRARLGITGFQGLLELKDSLDVSTVRIIANGNSFFNGGNVLIGTTTDSGDKLQVNGTIAASPATQPHQVVVKSQIDTKLNTLELGSPPDYMKAVVLLHPLDNTNPGSGNSFNGHVYIRRYNGLYPPIEATINSIKSYNTDIATGTCYITYQQGEVRTVTFNYGGIKWLGISVFVSAATSGVSVDGYWTNTPIMVNYYNTFDNSVVDAEINASITDYTLGGPINFIGAVTAQGTGSFNNKLFVNAGALNTGDELSYSGRFSNGSATNGLVVGYSETTNVGVIGAITNGIAWRSIVMNPHGGSLGIGTTNPTALLDLDARNLGGGIENLFRIGENASPSSQYGLVLKGNTSTGVFTIYGVNGGTENSAPSLAIDRTSGRTLVGTTAVNIDGEDGAFQVLGGAYIKRFGSNVHSLRVFGGASARNTTQAFFDNASVAFIAGGVAMLLGSDTSDGSQHLQFTGGTGATAANIKINRLGGLVEIGPGGTGLAVQVSGNMSVTALGGSVLKRNVVADSSGNLTAATYAEAQFIMASTGAINTMLYNGIGGTFTVNKTGTGIYELTNAGFLPAGKCSVQIQMGQYTGGTRIQAFCGQNFDGNKVQFITATTDTGNAIDTAGGTLVTVRVYQ